MSSAAARQALNKLADLAEERPPEQRTRRIQRRLSQRFDAPEHQLAHDRLLEQAHDAGAVELERGKRELNHLYLRVILADLTALYRFLDRTPAGTQAERAAAALEQRLGDLPHAGDEMAALAAAWRGGRAYAGLGRDDIQEAIDYLRAFDAVLAGDFGGRDMRTVSTRRLGDSKLLERQSSRIARALRSRGLVDETASDRETLAALGLEKFPPEVRLAGPVRAGDTDLSDLVFVALPPEHAAEAEIAAGATVTTIENLASFNRYVREARAPGEVAVYTGGFPSSAVATLLAAIGPRAGACYHWGDIDPAGLRIAVNVGRHLGMFPTLWRMDPDLARRHGRPADRRYTGAPPPGVPADYIALADFLASPDAHTLEQEDLDPASPALTTTASASL